MQQFDTIPNSRIGALLVEGQRDKYVVKEILKRHQINLPFEIIVKNNIDQLLDGIVPEILASRSRSVGILADANDDLSRRWSEIRDRVHDGGIELPGNPDQLGCIVETNGKPRIGVWLMPDNTSTGELEDFVAAMIPAGDEVWPLSKVYISTISEPVFTEKKRVRAQLYAWLATRKNPKHISTAIEDKDLEVNGDLCQLLIAWLNGLFRT